MRVIDIPQIKELSIPGKILFVEDMWDSISSEESAAPIPESHRMELNRRLARHKSSPGGLLSLDELREKVESRK